MAVTILRGPRTETTDFPDPCAGIPTMEQAKARREAAKAKKHEHLNLPPPGEHYTILDALDDFYNQRRKGTLMFLNNVSGLAYRVKTFSPGYETVLIGPDHKHVHAVITEREARLYSPLWRV